MSYSSGSGLDVEIICEARARATRNARSHSKSPRPACPLGLGSRTPFRVECTMEEGDDADAASRTVVFDGAGKHELRVGGQVIDVNMDDDDRDGRRLVLLAFGEQVYQLDRSRPVADLTIGPGGLTGRTVVHATSSWPRLAYWCGAAPP